MKCPSNALFGDERRRSQQSGVVYQNPPGLELSRAGTVESHWTRDILLDTGCTWTLVRRDLVPEGKMIEGTTLIRCAHGDTVSYPLAEIEIEVEGRRFQVQAGVAANLPVSVLLGTDVLWLTGFLHGGAQEVEEAMAVTTRAQKKRNQEEIAVQASKELLSGTRPSPLEELEDESAGDIVPGLEFADDIFVGGWERVQLSRRQKRANAFLHAPRAGEWEAKEGPTRHSLDLTSEELKELQMGDETLENVRKAVRGEACSAGIGFFEREGLVYRRWTPPGRDVDGMSVEQLVLPVQCRCTVLQLAHEIPLAGHMGKTKTARCILQRFYWPTLYKDVAEFCKACSECQKASPRGVKRAPLIPLPVIDEPFSRIAMDIIGPLPHSHSGNKYVLVICDYRCGACGRGIVRVFARVGVPEEVLTDQGSKFMSQLLAEVYRLLQVKPIRTSPYHPQTDGLVERFNQTLKSMLRKTATEDGKDWDRLIPYVLFAYREIPQASTGFSPFELLYGRQVRGPLDILRESWEARQKSDESVVSYVLAVRERLARMTKLVQENLARAQKQQKSWYDRNARSRAFEPGDQVLVLLPTATSKLFAQWQGPYKVTRRVGKVNYEVDMSDRRKRRRIFHINLLRKWHTPVGVSYWAEEDKGADWEEDVLVYDSGASGAGGELPIISDSLDSRQERELQEVLDSFADVLCNEPGRTTLAEHGIETGEARPVRMPPYRLPHAYQETVLKDLEEMEERGIIEPSGSDWAAPIVVVKKKDGTLCLCVDYRRLHAVSRVDAYPMPRIDDLIDQLGKAKYITTLDLTRGYWQVPVEEGSRAKTAFTTPSGLYQFSVMPFGLNGAPATFQRMMDRLLRGLGDFAAAYLDDLVVYSSTWEEHLGHIRTVFGRLRDAGLTAKPKKCQFGMSQCVYLGHVVGDGVVQPEQSKIEAVESFPVPRTKKQVHSFLGLTGYYRKFIPDYAAIATPLTDLTRKTAPTRVVWSADCDTAFKELKGLLCSCPVLKSPDFDKPFVLQTDASDRGVGAVLSQLDDEGAEHPVAYFSRKLLPREERYSTVEKECLAIKLGVQIFRVYLLGRPFTIQMDHRSLAWLDRVKENNSRLTRWSLALQSYNFEVQYRAGKMNQNADALSRADATN